MGKKRDKKRSRSLADQVARAAIRLALCEMEVSYGSQLPGRVFLELVDVSPGFSSTVVVSIRARLTDQPPDQGLWWDESKGSFVADMEAFLTKKGWDWRALRLYVLRQVIMALREMKVPTPRKIVDELSGAELR